MNMFVLNLIPRFITLFNHAYHTHYLIHMLVVKKLKFTFLS